MKIPLALTVSLCALAAISCNRDHKRVIAVIPKGQAHIFWQSVHAGDVLAVTAYPNGSTVVLINDEPGAIGNISLIESVQDQAFFVEGMSGGAGRNCVAGTGCSRSDDCFPGLVCGLDGTCR